MTKAEAIKILRDTHNDALANGYLPEAKHAVDVIEAFDVLESGNKKSKSKSSNGGSEKESDVEE